jgi:hypothetical protein
MPNKPETAEERYLKKVIDKTNLEFRVKVPSENSLFMDDYKTITLSEMLKEYSSLVLQECIKEMEKIAGPMSNGVLGCISILKKRMEGNK